MARLPTATPTRSSSSDPDRTRCHAALSVILALCMSPAFIPTIAAVPSGIWPIWRRPPSRACLPGEYREDRLAARLRVPAPVSRQRLYDLEPPATLTAGRRDVQHWGERRGVRHGDDHRF